MRHYLLAAIIALGVHTSGAHAAGDVKHPKHANWSFDGVFGTFDDVSIQRGLQVYREVCAACHGLKRMPFRRLTEVGFSEDEVKALAAEYSVMDGPNDEGEMFERPAKPSDKFPSPYANEKQARAMNNGAYPPDLSLIIKARPNGANYTYSLLTGYGEKPDHGHEVELMPGQYYNPYFPGGKIGMPKPISEGQVDYQDGTQASIEQQAKDVVNFLQWAAEPEMEHRKRMGLRVMIFLSIMTVFFYIATKRVWAGVKKK